MRLHFVHAALAALIVADLATVAVVALTTSPTQACQLIEASVSSASSVYYPGSEEYLSDIKHWTPSSSNASACSVQPGTAEDISIILGTIGDTRTPFAVKGGGHSTNTGYSSTIGVHISMKRFDEIIYDEEASTVVVGAGLVWNDVYAALQPHGVNAVGGRSGTVGVAGFTLGGGYSWLSNSFGLAVDTVVAYEIVLPTYEIKTVTEVSDPDLFFALKGGFNNYGIVTKFTFKTFPQGQVWGGVRYISSDQYSALLPAVARFSNENSDPKAAILANIGAVNNYAGFPKGGVTLLQLFYNGPTPPQGIFDELSSIPAISENVSTRSFYEFLQSLGSGSSGLRTVFHTVGTTAYPIEFLQAVVNETLYYSDALASSGLGFVSYTIEPFLPQALSHASTPSAYPPSRSVVYLPTCIYFSWDNVDEDAIMIEALKATKHALDAKALELGQDISHGTVYTNYALAGLPLEDLYGKNLPRLSMIRKRVDPFDVMKLAGGWKL